MSAGGSDAESDVADSAKALLASDASVWAWVGVGEIPATETLFGGVIVLCAVFAHLLSTGAPTAASLTKCAPTPDLRTCRNYDAEPIGTKNPAIGVRFIACRDAAH